MMLKKDSTVFLENFEGKSLDPAHSPLGVLGGPLGGTRGSPAKVVNTASQQFEPLRPLLTICTYSEIADL